MSQFTVITTINHPTEAVIKFAEISNNLVLVGDRKSPKISFANKNVKILDVEWQNNSKFTFSKKCPFDHYSRKNIGYLYAIREGADSIFDTDDDNIPYEDIFIEFDIEGKKCDRVALPKFVNIYHMFTDEFVWPRGFPLSKIKDNTLVEFQEDLANGVGLIQSLANGDTDVDALYRLILGKDIIFNKRRPIVLGNGNYCPINSQSTMWFKESFVYMYLPITVSFRMTDILRGYIAQRGLAAMGKSVAFVSPVVYQKRNKHNLMKDFADEIELYLHTEKIISVLDNVNLIGNPIFDIQTIYNVLNTNGFVKDEEIDALKSWISDLG